MATVKVLNNHDQPIGFINVNSTNMTGISNKKGFVGFYQTGGGGGSGITFTKDSRIFCYGNGLDSLIRLAEAGIDASKLMK